MMRDAARNASPPLDSPLGQPDFRAGAAARRRGHLWSMRRLAPILLLALFPVSAHAVELRLGVLAHDVGVFGGEHESGADGNVEVLFDSPSVLAPLWAPRPHLGVSVNSAGNTSQAYAGLTWTWDVTRRLFLAFSLGGAVHDGETETDRQDRINLGSRVLFRESLSIGFWITENQNLSLMLSHISNANLAEHNEGMDNFGIRWGYRF
ncbi:MAG: acyloxyacyl hydrolase [Pseudomonadota bacterium]